MTEIDQAAKRIVEGIRAKYSGPSTFVPAHPRDFPHLDLDGYKQARAQLASMGYRHVADMEILEVSNAPNSLLARTFISYHLSDDGDCASYYQVKKRMKRLLQSLVKGLFNLRLIAAPRFFWKSLKTRHCFGFEAEFSDGSFIATSNAEAAAKMSGPASIDSEFHPYGTDTKIVLKRHRERLDQKLAKTASLQRLAPASMDDILSMEARLKEQKNAHRATVNWISKSELTAMSKGNPKVSEAVFDAVRKLLREEAGETPSASSSLSPEADQFLKESIAEFTQKQIALKENWRFEEIEQWFFDQEDGILKLEIAGGTQLHAAGQILGTFCISDSSFEWAWNNPHISEAVAIDSKLAKAVGERLGISYLKAGLIPVPHEMLISYVSAIGVKASDSVGIFRGQEGDVHPLIMMKDLRWV